MDRGLTLIHITHLELGYHCRHCEPLTGGSPNPPQWSTLGGPAWHRSACLLCGPVCGWSRDADRALGTASAPGPGNSQPCTTSSFSPTSLKTTSVPVGERRARSRATPSASMNLCVTTTQTLCSRMRRTPTQTASWLRWGWCVNDLVGCWWYTDWITCFFWPQRYLVTLWQVQWNRPTGERGSCRFTEGCSHWCLLNLLQPIPLLDYWLMTFTWGDRQQFKAHTLPSSMAPSNPSYNLIHCLLYSTLSALAGPLTHKQMFRTRVCTF